MNKFRQFVVYAKIAIIVLILAMLVLVVVKNCNYKTRFWPWADQEDVPTLYLMLATSAVSICVFWIFARMRRVFRELAQVRQDQKQAQTVREQQQLRDELNAQERRIDEKLKRGIGSQDDNSQTPPGGV